VHTHRGKKDVIKVHFAENLWACNLFFLYSDTV
jgi:hypothetical protein